MLGRPVPSQLVLIFFYFYSQFDVFRSLGKVIAGVAVLITYAQLESEERIEFNFGVIVTILLLTLIGAPLFNLVISNYFFIRKILIRNTHQSGFHYHLHRCNDKFVTEFLKIGILVPNRIPPKQIKLEKKIIINNKTAQYKCLTESIIVQCYFSRFLELWSYNKSK